MPTTMIRRYLSTSLNNHLETENLLEVRENHAIVDNLRLL